MLNILQTGGDVPRIVTYDLLQTPVIFLLSSALLWVGLLLIVAITGRLFLSGGLLLAACVVIGFANYQKLHVRNEPLLPSDLSFAAHAGFLMDMVSTKALLGVVAVA